MSDFKMPCRDIRSLKAVAQEAATTFLNECKKAGLVVGICETIRTAEYQNSLYQQGRTKPGKIVTNCDGYRNKSNHQGGLAFDYFQNIKGHEWDKSFYDKAASIGKKLGLGMGHYWTSFKDSPHCDVPSNWINPIKENIEENKEDTEMVEKGKFKVNGAVYEMDRILKDDINYIKVADLKKAFFQVSYDEVNKLPVINSPKN